MTIYHVWLCGREEPEQIEADQVYEAAGDLMFLDEGPSGNDIKPRVVLYLLAPEWQRWAVVDEAGT